MRCQILTRQWKEEKRKKVEGKERWRGGGREMEKRGYVSIKRGREREGNNDINMKGETERECVCVCVKSVV